jgi:putative ABC transport system permease protein
MRAAWRLCISNLSARRSRTALLIAVVALSAVLIAAVGVAMGSVLFAVQQRAGALVGSADVRLEPKGSTSTLDRDWLAKARSLPQVADATGTLQGTLSLRFGLPAWLPSQPQNTSASGARDASKDFGASWTDSQGPFTLGLRTIQATTRAMAAERAEALTQRESASNTQASNALATQSGQKLLEGRWPAADDEIAINQTLIRRLLGVRSDNLLENIGGLALLGKDGDASEPGTIVKGPESVATAREARERNAQVSIEVGSTIELLRPRGGSSKLRVVGIVQDAPLAASPWACMTVPGLARATNQVGRLSRVELMLEDGADAEAFAEEQQKSLPPTLLMQTTQRVTSGLAKGIRANQLAFLLGTMMAFLAASFIIMTGMSTGIVERTRELAILRAIGAQRRVLAMSQLMSGALIGACGAIVGVPIGTALAWVVLKHFEQKLAAPPTILPERVAWSFIAAIIAGVVGAALPAWQASRVSPLQGLSQRAKVASSRGLVLCAVIGAACVLTHLFTFQFITDGTLLFYFYIAVALPAFFVGYFLLGVPVTLLVSRVLGAGIEALLRVPRGMLTRSVRGTPYRFGFTASAMMLGLSLLVSIWTQGGAAIRDWLDQLRFPDAFVVGVNLPQEAQQALAELPAVTDTSAVTLQPVETESFGVRGMTRVQTFFIAFDIDAFFRMTALQWVQGDPVFAQRRLQEGGAVIVSKEFLIARGTGVGSEFVCWDPVGTEHRFEVVGVVASPGLEVANNVFDVGQDITAQRVHAVFGSRKDLKEKFGNESIGMVQLSLRDDVTDEDAISQVREAMAPYAILNAASGRAIKETLLGFVRTTLLISMIAVFAMVVASFGVANLIIAGVHARAFEFGVLRAVGASDQLPPRLVLGEALIVACSASLLGTCMGVQGAYGGNRLNALIWGIELKLLIPWLQIGLGALAVIAICVLAATPTAMSLVKKQVRELLAVVKG